MWWKRVCDWVGSVPSFGVSELLEDEQGTHASAVAGARAKVAGAAGPPRPKATQEALAAEAQMKAQLGAAYAAIQSQLEALRDRPATIDERRAVLGLEPLPAPDGWPPNEWIPIASGAASSHVPVAIADHGLVEMVELRAVPQRRPATPAPGPVRLRATAVPDASASARAIALDGLETGQ